MDTERAALEAFRGLPPMPETIRLALAGATCIGAACGIMIGYGFGWLVRGHYNRGKGELNKFAVRTKGAVSIAGVEFREETGLASSSK